MGKSQLDKNEAANASLSLTLNHLKSTCAVIENKLDTDRWIIDARTPLNTAEQTKALKQVHRVKKFLNAESVGLDVSAYNDFPTSCGLASSASSMAAITMATARLICKRSNLELPTNQTLAKLSQLGSGSSCRSFFTPFALWNGSTLDTLQCPIKMHHRVIILSSETKRIKSSQAHAIISQSQDLPKRIERANQRVASLIPALQSGDWSTIRTITEDDSKDMHALLEKHQICYRNAKVADCFKSLASFMQLHPGFEPITTMDAGPNIHVLLRETDIASFDKFLLTESWHSI